MKARLAALHVVAGGLLVAAWLTGGAAILLDADRFYALPVLGCVLLVGIGLAAKGRWDDVEWVADIMPILGLIGTVIGFIVTAETGDLTTSTGKVALAIHVLYALVSNLGGVCGYFWLTFIKKVCAP